MINSVPPTGFVAVAEFSDILERHGFRCFEDFMSFQEGTRICHKRGRSVFRFELEGRAFYLKRNRLHPVEFWKALSRFRIPALGAFIEWKNILALRDAGIPTVTPVAMGECSRYGIETESFTLTEEIYDAEPLDVVVRRDYSGPLSVGDRRKKWQLIRTLAGLAAKFHGSGMNHQDFYLNHFFLGYDGTLFLLDLQRVGRRSRISCHYRIKDLAQLAYSSLCVGGLSRTDRMRFFLEYLGQSSLHKQDKELAHRVASKVRRIARHDAKLSVRRRKRGELPAG
jgi:lipopolysaccharide core heptose(I) kinase